MVLVWTSLWMLAVPLFHVHPDADHLHGRAGHLHGGTVHTVMSPDLECEVESHSSLTADSHDLFTTVAGLGHRHLEIEFSLLTDSDRKSYNLFLSQAHALGSAVSLNCGPRVLQEPETIALFSPTGLIYDLSSRGPPSLSA
ncbi:MAG TPA: hypothetical protein DDY39_02400 [Nitrospira sp.]|nr:hypothetical protein [Nitrospira sp.]HBR49286.1 hypothetical protein [Nitrospira sp.]